MSGVIWIAFNFTESNVEHVFGGIPEEHTKDTHCLYELANVIAQN